MMIRMPRIAKLVQVVKVLHAEVKKPVPVAPAKPAPSPRTEVLVGPTTRKVEKPAKRRTRQRLAADQARELYEMAATGQVTPRELQEMFGVPRDTVDGIIYGISYKNATGGVNLRGRVKLDKPNLGHGKSPTNDATVRQIRRAYWCGNQTATALAREHNMHTNSILDIVNGKSRRAVKPLRPRCR